MYTRTHHDLDREISIKEKLRKQRIIRGMSVRVWTLGLCCVCAKCISMAATIYVVLSLPEGGVESKKSAQLSGESSTAAKGKQEQNTTYWYTY